jgi:4-hydroxybenzoate polyprenyltransferase
MKRKRNKSICKQRTRIRFLFSIVLFGIGFIIGYILNELSEILLCISFVYVLLFIFLPFFKGRYRRKKKFCL